MAKFNIHDWQNKQKKLQLEEYGSMGLPTHRSSARSFSIPSKEDSKEKIDRTLDYQKAAILGPKIAMLLPEDYSIKNFARDVGGVVEVEYGKHNIKPFLDELENYFSIYGDNERSLKEQDDDPNWQKRQDRLTPGKNPDAFYGPDSPYQQLKKDLKIKKVVDQSMDNDDIGKLQDVIRDNDLGKILNTIAVILDRTGDAPVGAAQMIADLVAKLPEPKPEEELDEANMTGTGASFNAGSGEGYMTPKAFKKKRKDD